MVKMNEILIYWFNGLNDETAIDKKAPPANKWFTKDKQMDEEIRERFEADLIKASQGTYKDWEETPGGRLSLVILWDQFARNIYRNTPQMFATDAQAVTLSLKSIRDHSDHQLSLIQRLFLYMPLMHAEDLKIQKKSLQQFQNLVDEVKDKNPLNRTYYEETLNYAKRHFSIIVRFGRFPHRNAILGRESTLVELEFLKQPGSSFY